MASHQTIAETRLRLKKVMRHYFERHHFLEIDTPTLLPYGTAEPYIDPFESIFVDDRGRIDNLFLIPSPEVSHKKILASGVPRTWELARVFRSGESRSSAFHHAEFTMLEFYEVGADYNAIMRHLEALVRECVAAFGHGESFTYLDKKMEVSFVRITVDEAFLRFAGIDLSALASWEDIVGLAHQKGFTSATTCDDAFYLLFLNLVEPRLLDQPHPLFLTDYPAFQAAFSKLSADGRTGERFELYWGGLELANGYSELTDAKEQAKRFAEGNDIRVCRGKNAQPTDPDFLLALDKIPRAGGVALGFERLLMLLTGASSIREVLHFPVMAE